ncbi:MAG: carboxypeptidase regulatory-like domain-containing protein [Bryobacteraceae bacterium]
MERFRWAFTALALCALSAVLPGCLWAQANRGAIKGQVQDTQQAAVSGAQLTLNNEATGVTAKSTSGKSGQFSFVDLAPGNYTLTTTANGFTTSAQQHIPISVGQTLALTVTMKAGVVTQTVTVEASPAAVESETSDIGTTITPREIENLPLPMSGDMRNPLSFVLLTPGVYGSTPGATPDYRLHISGSVSDSDQVFIDGIPEAKENLPGNIALDHPPMDAISEFKLINNNSSARYGFSSGIVSFAFKSGTNAFHGSLSEYLQNDKLNAAGFVANATGKPKPPLKQNEYGGTIGGPVWIPRVYNGHNKTFFFVTYTGFKYRPSAVNATLTTLPNAYRNGDFSQSLGSQLMVDGQPVFDPAGRPVLNGQIYNPFSVHTVIGPDGKSYQVRDPFPANQIPSSLFSKVSQSFLKYYPKADTNALFNNLIRRQSTKTDEHRLVVRLDEHLNDKNTLSGSLFRGGYVNSDNGGLNLTNAGTRSHPTTQIRLTFNHTFSPTWINNFNAGFLRDTDFSGPLQVGPGLAALGITGLPPLANDSALAGVALGTLIGGIGGNGGNASVQNRFIENDNMTLVRGNQTFTFGGDLRRIQSNEFGIPSGTFTFEPTQSGLNGTGFINGNQAVSVPAGTGNPAASFLFGGMDFVNFGYPAHAYYRWWQAGLYFQDDWKVTPDLTLNLGLRWDLQIPRTEKYGNVSTMNPGLPNPAAGGLLGAYTYYGTGPGRNGRARIGNIYYKGFQPRIGFAYSPGPDHKWAFRSGFAIVRPLGNDNAEDDISGTLYDTGFATLATLNRPQDYVGSPAYYWDNPYPSSAVSSTNLDPGTLVGNDNPTMIHPVAGLPPTQIYWTSQVQRQIGNSMVASIGYVGMHTYHIGVWAKPNEVDPAFAKEKYGQFAAAHGIPLNEFLATSITDPIAAEAGVTPPWPGFVSTFGPAATIAQSLRPWPQYGDTDNPFDPIGNVSYSGLQAKFQKRFSHGLTFLVSYSFSKTIGDVDSNSGPNSGAENAIYAGSFMQNFYDQAADRSVTSSDIPQVLSLSYTYQLPFGKGRALLNRGGWVNAIVGGWSISGLQQYQSGRPIHIEYDAFGSSNPYFAAGDGFSFRPDVVPGVPLKNPAYNPNCSGPVSGTGRSACQFYINPAAFTEPPSGEFGNAPNLFSQLRMPAFFNEDLSLSKQFNLTERVHFQFQANAFNAFNRVIFSSGGNAQTFIVNGAPPDLNASTLANSSTIFGIMTAQQNGPRIIQLGAKLTF